MTMKTRRRIVRRLMACETVEQVCIAEGLTSRGLMRARRRAPDFDAACAESIRACRLLPPRYPPPYLYLMTPKQRRDHMMGLRG